ncbi:MAG: FAD-binding oxidoreductase [Myxococcales bacterium]|nr:FAD-binding oxidoreductase [Myxococcales bacterium]
MVALVDDLDDMLAAAVGAAHARRQTPTAAGFAHERGHPATWVVRPGAPAEVAEVIRAAARAGAAVVPLGTGSRRRTAPLPVGRPRVLLELGRLAHVAHLDETSLLVHAQAGLTGIALENLLVPRGLTLGDFPPAALRSSLGGLLAVRTPGKSSPRHGSLEDAVLGLSAVLADGRTIHTRVAPRRATGPDLARAFLGTEGTLGVITQVVLRLRRRPEARLFDAHRFASVDHAVVALAAAFHKEARPAAARVYDADETRAHFGDGLAHADCALLVVATAGPRELAALDRTLIADAARAAGADPLGAAPAELWWRRRSGHALHDAPPVQPALVLFAPWARLGAVHRAARSAARAAGRTARAHLSRFDDEGACVFITLLDGERADPAGPARAAVLASTRAAGGLPPGEREPALAPALAALKRALDPDDLLNPGVLP